MNGLFRSALVGALLTAGVFGCATAGLAALKPEMDVHGNLVKIATDSEIRHPGMRFEGDAAGEVVWACFDDADHPGDILCSSWAQSISIANGILKDQAERKQHKSDL